MQIDFSYNNIIISFASPGNYFCWCSCNKDAVWSSPRSLNAHVESSIPLLLPPRTRPSVSCWLDIRFYIMETTVPARPRFPEQVSAAPGSYNSSQQPVVVQVVTQQTRRTCKLTLHSARKLTFLKRKRIQRRIRACGSWRLLRFTFETLQALR